MWVKYISLKVVVSVLSKGRKFFSRKAKIMLWSATFQPYFSLTGPVNNWIIQLEETKKLLLEKKHRIEQAIKTEAEERTSSSIYSGKTDENETRTVSLYMPHRQKVSAVKNINNMLWLQSFSQKLKQSLGLMQAEEIEASYGRRGEGFLSPRNGHWILITVT